MWIGSTRLWRLKYWQVAQRVASSRSAFCTQGGSVGAATPEIETAQENAATYYTQNGFRKVYPYVERYTLHARGRWLNKTVWECAAEGDKRFMDVDFKVDTGAILFNGRQPTTSDVITQQDVLTFIVHKHEPGVVDCGVEILENSPTLLAVNKPPSMPTSPSGLYTYNSLFRLLHTLGFNQLWPLHRLDRKTSGVVLFAKDYKTARRVHKSIMRRETRKTYVCRVQGHFPSQPVECNAPIAWLYSGCTFRYVHESGQPAHTSFQLLHRGNDSSVVLCTLHTGRTHQIRVHLQYLGFPILNDDTYNNPGWGPQRGKGGVYPSSGVQLEEAVKAHLWSYHSPPEQAVLLSNTPPAYPQPTRRVPYHTPPAYPQPTRRVPYTHATGYTHVRVDDVSPGHVSVDDVSPGDVLHLSLPGFDPRLDVRRDDCQMCHHDVTIRDSPLPLTFHFLHALSNQGELWDVSTALPDWAREDWQEGKEGTGGTEFNHSNSGAT